VFDVAIENAFEFLSQDYADLFAHSAATPFQHPVWLDRFYSGLAPRLGAEPLIVVVRGRSDGRLAMLLPLVRRRLAGVLRAVEFADLRVADYASAVCDQRTLESVLSDPVACGRIRDLLKPYDLLRIKNLREGGLGIERLLGTPPRLAMTMSAHAVRLAAPYDVWRRRSVPASYLKELDKKTRQLERSSEVCFTCTSEPDAIAATLRSMQEFRRRRFAETGNDLLQNEAYFEFYKDVAVAGRDTFARTYTLAKDGRPIAGVFGLSHRGGLLVILSGFDLAGYKNRSIGMLTFLAVAEDAIARGDTELDFTIGDEHYKRLLGTKPTQMWMASAPGNPAGMLAAFAIARLPRAKAMAKRLLGDQSSAILRRLSGVRGIPDH
jgi:CelD/BcsL family acetyltransferase involved in cellulose biosynthesis